ncbi:hypothetical protein BDA99DRAFT_539817 [Phascolomyces articulosus]|uniref:Uncharacterized protein n=1 Tax=Phascolomyces articulosus TaxID=60185 RepID=A0AAD5K4X4_9FUNG|nr:hypothetical protein BDA99DRAFT_539817 [Phascolomyces articulosus]
MMINKSPNKLKKNGLLLIVHLPGSVLDTVSTYLSRHDCFECLPVCTTFYTAFLPTVYMHICFSKINQMYAFLSAIERAAFIRLMVTRKSNPTTSNAEATIVGNSSSNDTDDTETAASSLLPLERLTTKIMLKSQVHSWTFADDLQQLFLLCNIQAIILYLQELNVTKISNSRVGGIASTYRYLDMLRTMTQVVSPGINYLDRGNNNSTNETTAARLAIIKSMYKVPDMTNLTSLSLYYDNSHYSGT